MREETRVRTERRHCQRHCVMSPLRPTFSPRVSPFLKTHRSFLHPKLLAAKPHAALHAATPRSCAVARVMPVSCSFHTSGSTSCSPASQRAPQPTIAVLSLDGGGLKGVLTLQMLKVRAVHTPTHTTHTHTPTHARAHRQPRHAHRLETLRPVKHL